MTRSTRFVDAFWDPNITSTKGYDVIARRMKDGKKVCKELEEYLRERAKAESNYAKTLTTIARKIEGREEIGDLAASFLELRNQTEKIGLAHEHACGQFTALAAEVNAFNTEQTRQKNALEQSLKNQQQNKLTLYSKTMSLKEKYVTRCREKDNAEEVAKTAHKSVTTKTNDIAKADKNKEKATEARDQADLAYRSSVESVENARKLWEAEMERVSRDFQTLEETRVSFTRQQLWKVTNVDSAACVTHDERAENVRKTLEKCDIQKEIQAFINNNHELGNKRPEPVLYESYYKQKDSQDKSRNQPPVPSTGRPGRPPLNPPNSAAGRPPQSPGGRPPINPPQSPGGRPQLNPPPAGRPPINQASRPPMIPPTSRQPQTQNAQLISFDEDDSAYSTLSGETAVNVVRGHNATTNFEISVRAGETVTFVKRMPNGMVQIKQQNKCGLVPEHCLKF